jgi:hypothetical protein
MNRPSLDYQPNPKPSIHRRRIFRLAIVGIILAGVLMLALANAALGTSSGGKAVYRVLYPPTWSVKPPARDAPAR